MRWLLCLGEEYVLEDGLDVLFRVEVAEVLTAHVPAFVALSDQSFAWEAGKKAR